MPDKLKEKEFLYRKAKTLLTIQIVFLLLSFGYFCSWSTLVSTSKVPSYLPLLAALFLLATFKKIGNLFFSGNLTCLTYFSIFAIAAHSSGGIYSDDIVWAGGVPILAFLFVNKRSGFFWLVAFFICLCYYYFLELNAETSFRVKDLVHPPSYYLFSWMFLFSAISTIVFVFARGEADLVKSLLENERKLTQQRDEMKAQTEVLKLKERQLLKLNENLEHYAYAISHDLKEPLRTVKSYTQLLNRSLGENLNEKDQIYMDFVMSGTERMGHLLEDLLEYSRISEIHQEFVPVNLNDVLLLVVNNLGRKVRESKASIEVEDHLPLIKGTQSLMVIVMQNLVSNAIKFKHKERDPLIKIYHKKEAEHVVICVADNGIGIADNYKNKVFELFNRLHTRDQYDGSGIGLTTCGKILNSLGGKIWLESEPGNGTTFMISIPNSKLLLPNDKKESSNLEMIS